MKFHILTLFPQMFDCLKQSILGRAQKSGAIQIEVHNIRDFSTDNNKRCDDYSYGGGAGMVMTPQPIFDCIKATKSANSHVIFLSPRGKVLTQQKVEQLATWGKDLILLCGHYEGVDERVVELCVDEEISLGDFVLTGGEIPSIRVVDAVSRYVPGVLGNTTTTQEESFASGLLEYPQYTRPSVFEGLAVPQVLLDGDHQKVADWRLQQSIQITKLRRPDLFEKHNKNKDLH